MKCFYQYVFIPSVKFQYQYSLHDISRITQGLCRMTKDTFTAPIQVTVCLSSFTQACATSGTFLAVALLQAVRLWLHECRRVLRDCLLNEADIALYNIICSRTICKYFSEFSLVMSHMPCSANHCKNKECLPVQAEVEAEPLMFSPFNPCAYVEPPSEAHFKQFLDEKLLTMNEINPTLDLALTQYTMCHVSRIARVLSVPSGHMMLVGTRGSGESAIQTIAK